ncbi:MAG: sugar phosphate isomerase/epimerase [Lentisphaerae bacterium]|nr:MAG: sugar phosphate isomerase/epimerase [Lentisphaerota bacterium]
MPVEKATPPPEIPEKIRIGTLVQGNSQTAQYIKTILPYGFESFSITFWKFLGDVSLEKMAEEVHAALEGSNAVISCLSIFGNPLNGDSDAEETLRGWRELIKNAHRFGCDLVTGFTGRVVNKPIPDSIPVYREVYSELSDLAQEHGVRIAFENCSMGGNWQSGDWNIAHNPDAWQLMFEALDRSNIGLEWEPCHQMVQLIDPIAQLREWAPRIFHVHGKDATVNWDIIHKHGIGGPKPIAHHRTPGFGDSDWRKIITILRQHNFVGSIDIEGWHDPVYRGELEMTGQVHALNYLKFCRGGDYVPNP